MLIIEKVIDELNKNPEAAVYIGGVFGRYPSITMTYRFFSLFVNTPIYYTCPDEKMSCIQDIETTYNRIGCANYAIFIPYVDGRLNENIMYEIAFARYMNTKVYILSQDDLKMMSLCVDSCFRIDSKVVNETVEKLLKVEEKYIVKTN